MLPCTLESSRTPVFCSLEYWIHTETDLSPILWKTGPSLQFCTTESVLSSSAHDATFYLSSLKRQPPNRSTIILETTHWSNQTRIDTACVALFATNTHFTCTFDHGKEGVESGGKVQEEPEEAGGRRRIAPSCRRMNERRRNGNNAERSWERSWTWTRSATESIWRLSFRL